MSDAAVYRVGADRYLKIAEGEAAAALRDEIERTRWLSGQGVRVPDILRVHDGGDAAAFLMRAINGVSAADSALAPDVIATAAGRALAALHALPAADCPFDESVDVRLARAERAIARGDIDTKEFAPRNRQILPAALLTRLAASKPSEDVVVAHGDASLNNIIVGDNLKVGLVDCGHAGRGDRYLDLAVAADEIDECLGAAAVTRFMQSCGAMPWDRGKAAFFADLYELF